MNYSTNSELPVQKISKKKKTKEWWIKNVDAIVGKRGTSSFFTTNREDDLAKTKDAYWGDYSEEDFHLLTNPYKVDDGFPATPQSINIIKPKIDLLIGEESKKPFNYSLIQSGESGATLAQERMLAMLKERFEYELNAALGEEIDPNNPPMSVEQINKYIKYDFKTLAEKTANTILNYTSKDTNLPHQLLSIWRDYLTQGEGIYYVGIKDNQVVLERVMPEDATYDYNESLEFIEKGDWFLRKFSLTHAQIYDRWYDKIDESDLDKLLEASGYTNMTQGKSNKDTYSSGMNEVHFKEILNNSDLNALTVYHAVWRGFQKVGLLTRSDGSEDTVDEDYEPVSGESIEWTWVVAMHEGYVVEDPEIYFGTQLVEFQDQSISNPNAKLLPYGGIVSRKSLVKIMMPLQKLYIEVFYRLTLALARDKGRVINMDITQIPKSMGIGVDKWMHYLSALGVNLINPYEEGWNIPGRTGGKPASFNQMSSMDLSMSNIIGGYMQIMDKIETMVGELSGVSRQRQGSISSSELVGNVERSVVQSSNITEPLFWMHNQLKKHALTQMLNCAKYMYANPYNKKVHHILDDGERVFLDISDDFLNADLGIFVSDSTKDFQRLESLKSLLQPAMQSGASLSEAAEILTSDNITLIKQKLKEVDDKRSMLEQQQSKMEQELKQQALQQEAMYREQDMQLKQTELQIKDTDSIRKANTQLEVALLTRKESPTDTEGDLRKLEIERLALNHKINLENSELDLQQKQQVIDKNLKESELAIKKIVANKPKTNTKK